jgi:hypothetical protein
MLIKKKAIITIYDNTTYKTHKLKYNRVLRDHLYICPTSTIVKIRKLQKSLILWTYIFDLIEN